MMKTLLSLLFAVYSAAGSALADDLPPPREGRFVDNGDGTVTDTLRRMMWAKADNGEAIEWRAAWEYCEGLALAGHDDWHMPSGNELSNKFFDGLQPPGKWIGDRHVPPFEWKGTYYWTTTDADAGHGQPGAFIRDFSEGYAGASRYDDKHHVRACRSLPRPEGVRFADNGDGTVTDRWEGLVWAKADSGRPMTFGDANNYCNNLELAGKKGWHVPAFEDLHDAFYIGLEDLKPGLGLNRMIAPFVWSGEYYWTSRIEVKGEGGAGQIVVRFLDGSSEWSHRDSLKQVRPCWP